MTEAREAILNGYPAEAIGMLEEWIDDDDQPE